jgi:uncharacterized lipoprotein YmbA
MNSKASESVSRAGIHAALLMAGCIGILAGCGANSGTDESTYSMPSATEAPPTIWQPEQQPAKQSPEEDPDTLQIG